MWFSREGFALPYSCRFAARVVLRHSMFTDTCLLGKVHGISARLKSAIRFRIDRPPVHSRFVHRYDAVMQPTARILACVLATAICLGAAWWSRLPIAADDPQAGEEEIHRAPGAVLAGKPAVADAAVHGTLRLTILDAVTRQPTFARLNVLGSDGNFYEPEKNPLAPWSLHRLGNRIGKGP